MSWPNRISLLRLLLVGPFIALLLNQAEVPWARYAAMGVFLAMAMSDALDGMLARRLDLRTRLGAVLDPLADKALIICAVILLSLRPMGPNVPVMPNWVVVAVVGKDLWVIAGTIVVYLVTDRLCVHPTRTGKVCTTGQMVMVGYALVAPDVERLAPGAGRWGILAVSWAAALLSVLAIISYTRLGLSFTLAEGKPLEDHESTRSRRD